MHAHTHSGSCVLSPKGQEKSSLPSHPVNHAGSGLAWDGMGSSARGGKNTVTHTWKWNSWAMIRLRVHTDGHLKWWLSHVNLPFCSSSVTVRCSLSYICSNVLSCSRSRSRFLSFFLVLGFYVCACASVFVCLCACACAFHIITDTFNGPP